jgi:hypothetical protein
VINSTVGSARDYQGYFTGIRGGHTLRAMSQVRIVLNFGKRDEPKRKPVTLPLATAVLCVDCECLSDARGSICPACGSSALMSVAAALGGALAAEVTARQLEADEHNINDVVRKLVDSVLQ